MKARFAGVLLLIGILLTPALCSGELVVLRAWHLASRGDVLVGVVKNTGLASIDRIQVGVVDSRAPVVVMPRVADLKPNRLLPGEEGQFTFTISPAYQFDLTVAGRINGDPKQSELSVYRLAARVFDGISAVRIYQVQRDVLLE